MGFKVIEAIFARQSNGKQLESFDVKVKLKEVVGKEMNLVVIERRNNKVVGSITVRLNEMNNQGGLDGWFEIYDS